jgi:HPt (histidine-containing phosphotransfer) domain-containing protein
MDEHWSLHRQHATRATPHKVFDSHPLIDMQTLNETRALLGTKFGFTVQTFLYDMQDWIEAIARAMEDEDSLDRILLASHSIRTSSLPLGAWRLAGAAAMIEGAAHKAARRQGDIEIAPQFEKLFDGLKDAFALTQIELQIYAERVGARLS